MHPSLGGSFAAAPTASRSVLVPSSAKVRDGLKSMWSRVRPKPRAASPPAEPRGGAAPTDRDRSDALVAARLKQLAQMDSETLLAKREQWLHEATAAHDMIHRLEEALKPLLDSAPAESGEAAEMAQELEGRRQRLTVLRINVLLAEDVLAQRGVGSQPPRAAGLVDIPDDPTLCLYCFSSKADMEFSCCRHQGACGACAERILRAAPRCPHCRAPDPVVRPAEA